MNQVNNMEHTQKKSAFRSFMSFIAIAIAFSLTSGFAHANIDWDLRFDQPNLGVFGSHDNVYGHATLFNFDSSTDFLDLSLPHGFGTGSVTKDGHRNFEYQSNFGRDVEFPWTDWGNAMSQIRLAPGQSQSFDFVWFRPFDPMGVSLGNYSAESQMCAGFGSSNPFGCGTLETKKVKLSWSVAEVPEPSTLLSVLLGLGLIGFALRQRAK